MDSVRFGRALGIGARSAAKALAVAADAATTPNPTPVKSRPSPPATNSPPASFVRPAPASPVSRVVAGPVARAAQTAAQTAARATIHAHRTSEGIARGGKRFGEAVWGPFVKLSGVLWLEITGVFFGLFGLLAGQAAWTHRAGLYSAAATRDDRVRAFVFLAMALIFVYFCVSSFVRARRRERRS